MVTFFNEEFLTRYLAQKSGSFLNDFNVEVCVCVRVCVLLSVLMMRVASVARTPGQAQRFAGESRYGCHP